MDAPFDPSSKKLFPINKDPSNPSDLGSSQKPTLKKTETWWRGSKRTVSHLNRKNSFKENPIEHNKAFSKENANAPREEVKLKGRFKSKIASIVDDKAADMMYGTRKQRKFGELSEKEIKLRREVVSNYYGAERKPIPVHTAEGTRKLDCFHFIVDKASEQVKPANCQAPNGHTVLLFTGSHGPTEEQGFPLAMGLVRRGVNVVCPNYGGWGESDKVNPSAQTLKEDAQALADSLVEYFEGDVSKIVFHGYSLGGGVAVHTALLLQEKGLLPSDARIVLDRTFTSSKAQAQKEKDEFLTKRNPVVLAISSPVANMAMEAVDEHHTLDVEGSLGKLNHPHICLTTGEKDVAMKDWGPKLRKAAYGENADLETISRPIVGGHEHSVKITEDNATIPFNKNVVWTEPQCNSLAAEAIQSAQDKVIGKDVREAQRHLEDPIAQEVIDFMYQLVELAGAMEAERLVVTIKPEDVALQEPYTVPVKKHLAILEERLQLWPLEEDPKAPLQLIRRKMNQALNDLKVAERQFNLQAMLTGQAKNPNPKKAFGPGEEA